MPTTGVWFPKGLRDAARDLNINVSATCTEALQGAVRFEEYRHVRRCKLDRCAICDRVKAEQS